MLCKICYRPSHELVCSQRCQGLAKVKARIDWVAARRLIMAEIARLDKDASICPGRLSKLVLDQAGFALPEERDALSVLRELLFTLREEGQLRFFQKNVLIPKGKGAMDIRGPIRVKGKG